MHPQRLLSTRKKTSSSSSSSHDVTYRPELSVQLAEAARPNGLFQ
ncbi:hypothetical protein CCHR01_06963 [Colletotrichum chrysophilum]|uniref:Uncharacterized protein n=1 Tax=Colletotrichum chrysophilum TaxID=1836956 RepID=A0AAD9ALF0_9PEZI|nr:hypothetical protein CCHR01_06963 [Colletotrichum chrysophilum]